MYGVHLARKPRRVMVLGSGAQKMQVSVDVAPVMAVV